MIAPRIEQDLGRVASHYDSLDRWYRELWGEHVHHGLWERGDETSEEAVLQLTERVADRAKVGPGAEVCDVGCGYGGTARLLADRGARVVGYTVSRAQYEYACAAQTNGNPRYFCQDWMTNAHKPASFDAVIAIESSEHMPDKTAFFAEAHRLLRPGGRMVVCAWLAREDPSPREVKYLLEPICREGRLPGMGAESEYRAWMAEAGFQEIGFEDLTRQVQRTWTLCVRRVAARLLYDREAWRLILAGHADAVFVLTVARIALAYRTGAMRYGLFHGRKPEGGLS